MANLELLITKILHWEGGFVNHPYDRGGPTNKGITLRTWQSMGYDKDGDSDIDVSDLKLLTKADFGWLLRNYYWDRWRANEIRNQSVAELLVDWLWCSGKPAITIPQRVLHVKPDGIVGPVTLAALNATDPEKLHLRIKHERIGFIHRILEIDITQQCFRNGWLRRIESFTYEKPKSL
ncbi:MAG: peptidoglycan domain protein [Bacteroidales bacterium]|nr:peptidoglycan domain protein [Bacteroidales bacterium]